MTDAWRPSSRHRVPRRPERLLRAFRVAAVVTCATLTAATARSARAQRALPECAAARDAAVVPATPAAGTLFQLRMPGGAPPVLGAVPIDSAAGITLRVPCVDGARADTVVRRIAARPGAYRAERLRVAPRFSAPPDSALAARLAREAALAADVSRQSRETPPLWHGPFLAPRPGRITSPFGSSRRFNDSLVSRHMGTDYAGAVGAPVRAANRGVVRLVGAFFLGGNVIYLDHGQGLVTAYLHLSRQQVAVGDTVERGATIGRVGATGRVTGPHLHFIARLDSITVDPTSLVGRAFGRPATGGRSASGG